MPDFNSASPRNAPAASLPIRPRVHFEGDIETFQCIKYFLDALEQNAAEIHSPDLRQLIDIEITCAKDYLHRFTIVHEDAPSTPQA